MTFLSPWNALFAAAAAVPLLLLLYLLRLRRRRQRIASTLLWQRSFEDLQANVPFQRLRWSALLLLQLCLLAALLLALARPILQTEARHAGRLILLVDQSASMSAPGSDTQGRAPRATRLDEAKRAALEIIERLGRGRSASELMVLAYGASARVVSGYESDRAMLADALESIEATDEAADLQAALELAGAFAGSGEDDAEQPPLVVLLSDGDVGEPDEVTGFQLRAGELQFVQVGPEDATVENIGIVSFSVRRDYREPKQVLAFARLISTAPTPLQVVVTLAIDGRPSRTRRVELTAAADGRPGEAIVTFTEEIHGSALVRLQHNRADALAADNVAAIVLPPPSSPRIALVHPDGGPDVFLQEVLEAMGDDRSRPMVLAEFLLAMSVTESGAPFDLVVFDRVAPPSLPQIPSITVGAAPAGVEVTPRRATGGSRILTWNRQHPIMRHVVLDDLVFADFGGFVTTAGMQPLATGPEGPVIIVVESDAGRHVVIGYELRRSNWPLDLSFIVFMQNAIDDLTRAGSGQAGIVHRPGDPIQVRVAPHASVVDVEGPESMSVTVKGGSIETLPAVSLVGLYTLRGVAPPNDRLAVSMLSEQESDIRPRSSIIVNAAPATSGGIGAAAPLELWPWLLGVALALICGEWLLYCRRLRY